MIFSFSTASQARLHRSDWAFSYDTQAELRTWAQTPHLRRRRSDSAITPRVSPATTPRRSLVIVRLGQCWAGRSGLAARSRYGSSVRLGKSARPARTGGMSPACTTPSRWVARVSATYRSLSPRGDSARIRPGQRPAPSRTPAPWPARPSAPPPAAPAPAAPPTGRRRGTAVLIASPPARRQAARPPPESAAQRARSPPAARRQSARLRVAARLPTSAASARLTGQPPRHGAGLAHRARRFAAGSIAASTSAATAMISAGVR